MAQESNREDGYRGANGARGQNSMQDRADIAGDPQRFRGDMDRDRNDGGWMPGGVDDDGRFENRRQNPDRAPDWNRQEPDRQGGMRQAYGGADQGGRNPNADNRWDEGRTRWNEGRERGAEFDRARYRQGAGAGRAYGDESYGVSGAAGGRWERPFERHPGEYQSHRQAERHAGDEHRDYRAWRDEQIRRMDDEYDEYRRHRATKFANDYELWRKDRYGNFVDRGNYVGQNDKIGATPVEFGGQNATNSAFTRRDDEGLE